MSINLEKLIKEHVKANNLPMVDALLTTIVPLVPAAQRDPLIDSVVFDALLGAKLEMVKLVVNQFPIDDAMAAGYLLDRSIERDKDREAMPIALAAVQESFNDTATSAIYTGDLETVRTLQALSPNRHIELSYAKNGRLVADGQEVKHQFEVMRNFQGVPAFRELIETLLAIVKTNDLEQNQGEFLYDLCNRVTECMATAHDLTDIHSFSGDFPTIQSGRIDHPELLLAFNEAQDNNLMKSMHSRLFCWVKTEEAHDLPKAIAYAPVKRAASQSKPVEFSFLSTPGALTTPGLLPGDDKVKAILWEYLTIDLGIETTSSDVSELSIYSEKILQKMLPDLNFMGLDHPAGYTLMSMDTGILKALDIGQVDPAALGRARDYAKSFYSSQLLSPEEGMDSNKTNNHRERFEKKSLSSLFEFAANSENREAIFECFDPVFWRNIYQACSDSLDAQSILEGRDRFGLTGKDATKGFSINPNVINELYEAGYRFDDEVFCRTTYWSSTPEDCVVLNRKLMEMGGWPNFDPRPQDVEDALKVAIRKKDLSLYAIYIQAHGAESAIEACKTEAQYRFLSKLFTTAEIEPFAHKLPLKQLGDVFSRDIGL